jgi:hypothetical protein
MKPNKLITCSHCSWSIMEAILQGSSGNLGTHLEGKYKFFKPGIVISTPIPIRTFTNKDISSFFVHPQVSVTNNLKRIFFDGLSLK